MPPTRSPAAALTALAFVVASAAPAAAHAALIASSPAEGATVTEPLTEVVLEFNEPVTDAQVQVADPAGESVVDGPPEEQGDTVVQAVQPPAEHGEHSVAFRVASADGHPVEGEFTFVYEGPLTDVEADEAAATPSPSPEPVPAATPAPEATAEPTGEPDDAELAAAPGEEDTGAPVGLIALGLLVLAALAGGWAFRRRLAGGGGA